MPEYLFSADPPRQGARALFRAEFPDHGAAIRHAEAVAAAHPDATTITISCDHRVVAHVPLRPHRSSEDVARLVHESRQLIARSRKLLRDTDGGGSAVAAATADDGIQEDSCR